MGLSVLAGVISGLISSFVIYIFTFGMRPRAKISDHISRDKNDGMCRIKIVNLCRANLVDVQYTLRACHRSGDGIIDIDEVAPAKAKLQFIQAYTKNDPDARYAVRISYDLSKYICPNYSYFEFTLYAKHPTSGTARFLTKRFEMDSIQCGKFETGKSTKVLLESSCSHAEHYVKCITESCNSQIASAAPLRK